MGSCVTRPGCPPCERFRGWNEWDGDLCNDGYAIVKTDDIVKNGTFNVSTIKPTALVSEAINKAEDALKNGGESIMEEIKDLEHDAATVISWILYGGEIFVLLVFAAIMIWIIVKICGVCLGCCRCVNNFMGRGDGNV